jgi:SAM-dependent methyltransferase
MSVQLINPASGNSLRRAGDRLVDGSGASFPVIRGVPRICDPENYTVNFGKQWNAFPLTQIDSGVQRLSSQRLFAETGWMPEQLVGANILEVGSGAGRFTRVLIEETPATIYSVDYSNAVDANMRTNGAIASGRLHLVQASIYDLPFPDESFDKVLCLGVLQHTPSFEASVKALVGKARKGGEIVVDFYPVRGWWTKLNSKYLLRPFTRRMEHDRLLGLIERNVGWMIGAHKGLRRIGLGALTRFIPIVDLRTFPRNLSAEHEREWAVLDTFDMFSPEYDSPQRLDDVVQMFRRSGAEVSFAGFVENGSGTAPVIRAKRL